MQVSNPRDAIHPLGSLVFHLGTGWRHAIPLQQVEIEVLNGDARVDDFAGMRRQPRFCSQYAASKFAAAESSSAIVAVNRIRFLGFVLVFSPPGLST